MQVRVRAECAKQQARHLGLEVTRFGHDRLVPRLARVLHLMDDPLMPDCMDELAPVNSIADTPPGLICRGRDVVRALHL
jgi:hypothetical protein